MSIRGMKLRRFLQGLKKRGPTQIIRSIAGISIEELSRGQHPPPPKFCRRLGCTFVTAWSAPSGRHWSLHQDDCPVFMGLVFGVKRVTIAIPSSAKNLCLHPHNALLSSIPHVRNIDPRKFPKAMGVEFLEAALLRGDLLYIPARWWHQVDYIEPSMSFSYWPA
jgi:Cupin-like domain